MGVMAVLTSGLLSVSGSSAAGASTPSAKSVCTMAIASHKALTKTVARSYF
jgi:hypothetical protein